VCWQADAEQWLLEDQGAEWLGMMNATMTGVWTQLSPALILT
jgi:hypothetical protein